MADTPAAVAATLADRALKQGLNRMTTWLQLQSEAAECGLACLVMVARAYGQSWDLVDLRRKFPLSLKGATLAQIAAHAQALEFSTRAVRLELDEIRDLSRPSILHWDLNHFVVLKSCSRRGVVVLDPAIGERRLSWTEASRHFTGVALELSPTPRFEVVPAKPRLRLAGVTGRVRGLRRALGLILVVSLALQLFAVAAPLLNQFVVDDVVTSGDGALLVVLILGFGGLLLVEVVLGLARGWMVMVLGHSVSLQWTTQVFAHLMRLPVRWFEQRHVGDIAGRFGSVGEIQRTITSSMVEAVLDGLMAVVALVMMWLYAPELCAVVICAVAAYALVRAMSYGRLRALTAERVVAAAHEQTHFLEAVRAIQPLKLFGREQVHGGRWQNLVVRVHNCDVRLARLTLCTGAAQALIFGVENLVVFWLGAREVMAGQAAGEGGFTIGMLFAFASYKAQFTGRVGALIDHGIAWRMLGLHAERLADIVLEPPERLAHGDGPAPCAAENLAPSLCLRNVSFRYAEGEPWILRLVNLRVNAGECLALVGPSGAGKTTLLKILLGILEPTEGEVLYGGVPLRQLGLAALRQQIGTVMQDDVLLSGSLYENIAFFDPQPDLARIESCARLAHIHDDIARMPMGYHTLVGDLGAGLSGGQRQRVLLARALYKQPAVLALDEGTSHLDVAHERAVTDALAGLSMTRLVIAHRPDTIAGAERVVEVRSDGLFERPASQGGRDSAWSVESSPPRAA